MSREFVNVLAEAASLAEAENKTLRERGQALRVQLGLVLASTDDFNSNSMMHATEGWDNTLEGRAPVDYSGSGGDT